VASPLIRRWSWAAAAGLAFAFLVGLALHGGRPDIMVQFKPAGLLTAFAPEDVREVEIATGAQRRRFVRDGQRWDASPQVAGQLDAAVRLMRNSGPLRVLSAEEVATMPPSEYALGPDNLKVSMRSDKGAAFVVQFGGRNPLGSARYAKVEGESGVVLLPTYVADAWERMR
jgi:hypothetical protein